METNERVNNTYNNMQMPKVENKTIVIDDYSMFPPAHVESADTQLTCVHPNDITAGHLIL